MTWIRYHSLFDVPAAGGGNLTVAPGAGSVVFTGNAPSVDSTAAPGAGSLVFTGLAPSADATVAPGVGSVTFTGLAPSVDSTVAPGVGSLVFTGYAPTVSFGTVVVATPSGAFDAGGFGKWYNLAFTSSSSERRRHRTGLGADIEALVYGKPAARTAMARAEKAVDRAIEQIAAQESAPETEKQALTLVADYERQFAKALRDIKAEMDAAATRQRFIDAIAARAREAYEAEMLRDEEEAALVLMLA